MISESKSSQDVGNEIQAITKNQEEAYQASEDLRRDKLIAQLTDRTKQSEGYLTNTPKEYLVLQYVENFNRQYSQLYPGRKPLGLIMPNECQTRKFIPTFIRPTQLPYKLLYDFRTCSKFVADFISYVPLDPPHELPKTLQSPTFTLRVQRGNSFDLATVLCSMLIGVGYDAYIASGYALKHITTMDQSDSRQDLAEFVPCHYVPKVSSAPIQIDDFNKYKVKPPKQLKSAFLMKQEDRLRQLQLQQERRLKETVQDSEPKEDELKGLRAHAWVLVLPGKRQVSEAFFIEPTTGKIYDLDTHIYLGLEAVWSNKNFWVNMQICYDGLQGISFDLGDSNKWEFVLLDHTTPNQKDEKEEEDIDKTLEIVEMPKSWVAPLSISMQQFASKCPTGGKTTDYKNASTEVFADYHRADGMIQRITFNQNDRDFQNMIVEIFSFRKDKLFQRVRINNKVHEFFHPGRSHGLKEHILIDGLSVEMNFFVSARADGLVQRLEETRKIIYKFQDRDDYLVYRSITFETLKGEVWMRSNVE